MPILPGANPSPHDGPRTIGSPLRAPGERAGIAGQIAKPGVRLLACGPRPLRAAARLSKLWEGVRADLDRVEQPLPLPRSATPDDDTPDRFAARVAFAGRVHRERSGQPV